MGKVWSADNEHVTSNGPHPTQIAVGIALWRTLPGTHIPGGDEEGLLGMHLAAYVREGGG